MITRTHNKNNKRSTAIYSDCENYRYSLTRTWDTNNRKILFIMLNPSTATEIQNDPTVERCERRTRARWDMARFKYVIFLLTGLLILT